MARFPGQIGLVGCLCALLVGCAGEVAAEDGLTVAAPCVWH
jgi:hypothetical protein